jgi:hypothetical protein
VTDLVQWLRTQLDEDERIARRATKGPWLVDCETHAEAIIAGDGTSVIAGGRWGGEASAFESTEDALHIAEHDPARVLREVEAKRGLLALHSPSEFGPWVGDDDDQEPACGVCGNLTVRFPCKTLRLLASMYDDRPGYQEAWRP